MKLSKLFTEFNKLTKGTCYCIKCSNNVNCPECFTCYECTDCLKLKNCTVCVNCYSSIDCINCNNCVLCNGLTCKDRGYYLLNQRVSEDAFDEAVALIDKQAEGC